MAKTPADEALFYEKQGEAKKRAALFTKDENAKRNFLKQAAESYRIARNYWSMEATQSSNYPRKAGHAAANAERDKELVEKMRKMMGDEETSPRRYYSAIASIISLLSALFFISMNITGNIISAGITEDNSKIVALLLFVCGLAFALIHFKKGRFKF